MEYQIYFYLAVVGCTLLGLQVILTLFGIVGDADVDGAHDADLGDGADMDLDGVDAAEGHAGAEVADDHSNVFFKILSLKALCAFAGLFGLTGLTLHAEGLQPPSLRLLISFAVGAASFVVVVWMMKGISKLTSSGTINVRGAVGRSGSVYLRVPAAGAGAGKVTILLQGQSIELEAVTDGDEIPTGEKVMVASVVGQSTLKVVPL
jgi:hypothetical protein